MQIIIMSVTKDSREDRSIVVIHANENGRIKVPFSSFGTIKKVSVRKSMSIQIMEDVGLGSSWEVSLNIRQCSRARYFRPYGRGVR